jgi:hypothetical protein
MITMNPSQMTIMSNCLVSSNLLKNSFGSSNTQLLQNLDSYLTGNATTASSSTGSTSSNSSIIGTDSSTATSGMSTSSLLESLINTLI